MHIAHRLTGWNAVKNRVEQLGLDLTDNEVKEATNIIKRLGDFKHQTLDDVDSLLTHFHMEKRGLLPKKSESENGDDAIQI